MESAEGTWQQNLMWCPRLDPGIEKEINEKMVKSKQLLYVNSILLKLILYDKEFHYAKCEHKGEAGWRVYRKYLQPY